MSKKTFKRSLVLGALMAFVITGSAMAASVAGTTADNPIVIDRDIVGGLVNTCSESTCVPHHDHHNHNADSIKNHMGTKYWNIGDNEISITLEGAGNEHFTSKANDGKNGVRVQGYHFSGSDKSILNIDGNKQAILGFGTIDVGTLNITSENSYAVLAQDAKESDSAGFVLDSDKGKNDTHLIANVINISGNSGIQTNRNANYNGNDYSDLFINAKELNINVDRHAIRSQRGNVTINVENLDIEAGDHAIKTDSVLGTALVTKLVVTGTANIKGKIYTENTVDLSGINDLVLVGLTAKANVTDFVNTEAAMQVAEGGVLVVNKNGTLAIDNAKSGDVYAVVSGITDENALWADSNLAYDRTAMLAKSNLNNSGLYTVSYEAITDTNRKEAQDSIVQATGGSELVVPNLVGSAVGNDDVANNAPAAQALLSTVTSNADLNASQKAAVINSAAQLAEVGGNAGTVASVANNVSSVTTGRMSFNGGNKGGHGVGLFEEGSGAAVWAQYMHGKDDATDMPMDGGATSYESEYDGIVLGVDFKKVGKFQSGVAFNYGEGDSTGFTSTAKTQSDYDFWGIGYYGNIRNEDTNFIFDVNYAKSDSDVTQKNITGDIEASPETTTWSAGVKVEKLYQNNNVQIVPYTGLRYMSIDTEEYQSNVAGKALFNYAPERQDIWLLPLGVSIRQEIVNDNGWVVTPKVDLSYIWAFGDTDSNMSVSIPGIAASNDTLGFTVMDDGSFLGLVGVEAKMEDWTFGVSYSYQKGDYAESKKWFVDAKYSF